MGCIIPADSRIRLKQVNRTWTCTNCGAQGGVSQPESITHSEAKGHGMVRIHHTNRYTLHTNYDGCYNCCPDDDEPND